MARLALPLRQRLVRDTPKQVLEEGVLTALGRPRVGLHREDLLAHQTDHERVELVLAEAGQRAQTDRSMSHQHNPVWNVECF